MKPTPRDPCLVRKLPKLFCLLVSACYIISSPGFGPARADTQVNTYTTGSQTSPALAVDARGRFVVVWRSDGSFGTDSSEESIQAQRYASDGSTIGGEFQINTYTTGIQLSPAVATDADGDFIVVWRSLGSTGTDASATSIQGQLYASDGSAVGGEFQINTYTTGSQRDPSVAMDANGNFAVFWNSQGSTGNDTSSDSIQGQRYAAGGSQVGGQFQVNTYTTGKQYVPQVAMRGTGEFIVVWTSDGSAGTDTWSSSIQGQRFASDGTVLGGQFQVNSFTPSLQDQSTVAMSTNGEFVVVWSSYGSVGSDNEGYSIQGQRFASDGATIGGQFQVNTLTLGYQNDPTVAMNTEGEFGIVWASYGSVGSDDNLASAQGQLVSDGFPVGSQFQINSYITGFQRTPAVMLDETGTFRVVWASLGSGDTDTSESSIQWESVSPIFGDGFESGDTSAWSQPAS